MRITLLVGGAPLKLNMIRQGGTAVSPCVMGSISSATCYTVCHLSLLQWQTASLPLCLVVQPDQLLLILRGHDICRLCTLK